LEKGIKLNGQFPYLPHYSHLNDVGIVLPLLVSLFQSEVSKEIVIENIEKLFDDKASNIDDVSSIFANSLLHSSFSIHSIDSPFVTIAISLKDKDDVLTGILNGYMTYLEKVPISKFGLFIVFSNPPSKDFLNMIAKITKYGGKISLSQKSIRSSKGVFKINDGTKLPVVSLHSVSLNLPHLAYQSNKDETYFRTKLALLLKPSLNALVSKKDMIFDNVRKGLLPTLSNVLMFPKSGSTNMIINLTGIKESIFDILGYFNDSEKGIEIIKNVIKTANDVVSNFDKKNYDHFGISIVNDNSASRFVQLDSERFGKLFHTFGSYSQGLVITKKDLDEVNSITRNLLLLDDLLTGGFSVKIDTTAISLTDTVEFLAKSIGLIPCFEIVDKHVVCNVCGSRVSNNNICYICKSNNLLTLT
jgi:ribonucleoside-triphosphate reductase